MKITKEIIQNTHKIIDSNMESMKKVNEFLGSSKGSLDHIIKKLEKRLKAYEKPLLAIENKEGRNI